MKQLQNTKQWQAAWWKIFSCLCFAVINGSVRYLSGGSSVEISEPLPPYVIAFFQNLFASIFLLPWLIKDGFQALKGTNLTWQMIRVSFAVLGVGLWFWGLAHLDITTAVALNFTGPVFTVIGARFFLNEKLNIYRIVAFLLTFIGAWMVTRPDIALLKGDFSWAFILPLASAIAIAVTKLISRRLGTQGNSAKSLTSYMLIFMTPVSLIPALFEWVTPTAEHWHWLALMGLCGMGAHFALSQCYVLGEITFTTPFGFSKILLSSLVGYVFFAEFPDSMTVWLGAGIIFSAIMVLNMQYINEQKRAT